MPATWTRSAVVELRTTLRDLRKANTGRSRPHNRLVGSPLMAELDKPGGGGELRYGVLQSALPGSDTNCDVGTIDLYEQLGSACPTPTGETEQVINVTAFNLTAGPLMRIDKADKFAVDQVSPAQIEECLAGIVTRNE